MGAFKEPHGPYDYSGGACRQVPDANISMNLGWAMPGTGSSLVMRKG